MIRIVYEGGVGEIEEKKSRFIATVRPVHSEEDALSLIAALKKQYWNATHNCYAYVIGDKGQLMRCSDDGEPQGTAGRPMLDVLTGECLCDVVVVVTRYFGGTLLGTGGLVRAYSRAVSAGLAGSRVLERKDGYQVGVCTDYTDLGKIQYLLGQAGLHTLESIYEDRVRMTVLVPGDQKSRVCTQLQEATAGRIVFTREERVRYAEGEQTPIILGQEW